MKLTLIAEGLVVILVQTQVNVLLLYKSMLLKFRNLYSVLTIFIGLDICFFSCWRVGKMVSMVKMQSEMSKNKRKTNETEKMQ